MLQFFPIFYSAILFDSTHLFFYLYPLFFPEKSYKGHMSDHIFPSPFLVHARSGKIWSGFTIFQYFAPRNSQQGEPYGAGAEARGGRTAFYM